LALGSKAIGIVPKYLATEASEGQTVTRGTVKFFNGQKGFGFIQPDGGGSDVFVHVTALERAGISNLVEGQKVEYETQPDRRTGKAAVSNIRLV
jgi:CspA family cold shock protein